MATPRWRQAHPRAPRMGGSLEPAAPIGFHGANRRRALPLASRGAHSGAITPSAACAAAAHPPPATLGLHASGCKAQTPPPPPSLLSAARRPPPPSDPPSPPLPPSAFSRPPRSPTAPPLPSLPPHAHPPPPPSPPPPDTHIPVPPTRPSAHHGLHWCRGCPGLGPRRPRVGVHVALRLCRRPRGCQGGGARGGRADHEVGFFFFFLLWSACVLCACGDGGLAGRGVGSCKRVGCQWHGRGRRRLACGVSWFDASIGVWY